MARYSKHGVEIGGPRQSEPLTAEELEEIEEAHPLDSWQSCGECYTEWPCQTRRLVAMARRASVLEAALVAARNRVARRWTFAPLETAEEQDLHAWFLEIDAVFAQVANADGEK